MPTPVALYPLNARYKAAEKENRQQEGKRGDVAITNGPYNEPGGAYMFYGTYSSYIEFPEIWPGLNTQSSITLMCWVQPGGQDGPLFNYYSVRMWIEYGKLFIGLINSYSLQRTNISTTKILPTGKWVHVAASYDHNTGYNSLYVNGHLRTSQNIGSGYKNPVFGYDIRMGSTPYGRYRFRGKIAEMKVFNDALNEAQIQTSIRQGSCTFYVIVVSLPSPMIPLIIETPVIGRPR